MRQADGRWIVLGITSYGSATTPDIAPGVYVKLSAYKQWLEPYLKSD
jgi:secreted trypsin-like serine protease